MTKKVLTKVFVFLRLLVIFGFPCISYDTVSPLNHRMTAIREKRIRKRL